MQKQEKKDAFADLLGMAMGKQEPSLNTLTNTPRNQPIGQLSNQPISQSFGKQSFGQQMSQQPIGSLSQPLHQQSTQPLNQPMSQTQSLFGMQQMGQPLKPVNATSRPTTPQSLKSQSINSPQHMSPQPMSQTPQPLVNSPQHLSNAMPRSGHATPILGKSPNQALNQSLPIHSLQPMASQPLSSIELSPPKPVPLSQQSIPLSSQPIQLSQQQTFQSSQQPIQQMQPIYPINQKPLHPSQDNYWADLGFLEQTKTNAVDIFDLDYLQSSQKAQEPVKEQPNLDLPHEEALDTVERVEKVERLEKPVEAKMEKSPAVRRRSSVRFSSNVQSIPAKPLVDDFAIAQVVSMGFSPEQASIALEKTKGDVSGAVDLLLANPEQKPKSNLVESALGIGSSVLKGAKNMFELGKRKITETIETAQAIHAAQSGVVKEIPLNSSEQELRLSGFRPMEHDRSPLSKQDSDTEDEPVLVAFNQVSPSKSAQGNPPSTKPNQSLFEKSVNHSPLLDKPVNDRPVNDKPLMNAFSNPPVHKPQVTCDPQTLKTVEDLKEKGNDAFKRGQFHEASEFYTKAIPLLPPGHLLLLTLYNNRASSRLKTGEYQSCLEDCNCVLKEERNTKALLRRAAAYEGLEDFSAAQNDYKTLMGIEPSKAVSLGLSRCSQALLPKQPVEKRETVLSAAAQTKIQNQVDEAVQQLREQNIKDEEKADLKLALKDKIDHQIAQWSKGKETNIRALLSSLDLVLWPELGHKPIALSSLLTPQQVKVQYMKAVAKVHPDKLQQATVEQTMIAGLVFAKLNEAFDSFKSTGK
ncbi:hypothetical protein EDD86DRAFT_204591 [Gorgonomyces haynaldii]|nr:hypothetical protein EDD86DRAFT_204591 [Gorgonomyces haynaldii]